MWLKWDIHFLCLLNFIWKVLPVFWSGLVSTIVHYSFVELIWLKSLNYNLNREDSHYGVSSYACEHFKSHTNLLHVASCCIHNLYWHYALCLQEAHPVSQPWREVSREHECYLNFINLFKQDKLSCFCNVFWGLLASCFYSTRHFWVWWVGRGENVRSACSACLWVGPFFLLLRCGLVCFSHVFHFLCGCYFMCVCLCSGPRRSCGCVRRISRPSQWRWSWRDTTVSPPSPFHSLHLKPGTATTQWHTPCWTELMISQ